MIETDESCLGSHHDHIIENLARGRTPAEFLPDLLSSLCEALGLSGYTFVVLNSQKEITTVFGNLKDCLPKSITHLDLSHIVDKVSDLREYTHWNQQEWIEGELGTNNIDDNLLLHYFPLIQSTRLCGFLLLSGQKLNSRAILQLNKVLNGINVAYQLQDKNHDIALMQTRFKLNELLQTKLECSQPAQLIAHSCPILSEHFDAERSTFFAYNKQENIFQSIHAEGLQHSIKIKSNQGLIGTCFASNQPFYTNNPYERDDFYQHVDVITGFKTNSALLAPLYLGSEIFGVLQILNSKLGFNEFDLEHIKILSQTLSGHLNTFQMMRNRLTTENDFNALLETIPEVLYQLDLNGNFLFLSHEIIKWGYMREDLIGKHFKEIIHPLDLDNISRKTVLEKFAGKTTGSKNSPGLFDERRSGKRGTKRMKVRIIPGPHIIFKDLYPNLPSNHNEYFHAEVNSSGHWVKDFSLEAQLLGTIGIISDITDRHFAELKLISTQRELIRVERFNGLSTLASGIAHDFNNILSAIRLNADISSEVLKQSNFKDDLEIYIQSIKDGVDQASDLTHRLLSLGRAHFSQPSLVNIQDIIQNAIDVVQLQLYSAGVHLTTSIAPEIPTCYLDETQIRDVIINLLKNSINALEDINTTGSHNLAKKEIQISAEVSHDELKITICDNGIGIESDVLPNVFDPFFTTHSRDSRKGTGLGLAMAFAVVSAHQGRIEIRTNTRKESSTKIKKDDYSNHKFESGTTVSISLPILNHLSQINLNKLNPLQSFCNQSVIYVVNSEPSTLELISAVLNSAGYQVAHTFENINQTITFIQEGANIPDILIAETKNSDNLYVYKTITELCFRKQPKVIILEGMVDAKSKCDLQSLGIKHFLKKPYSGEDVLEAVNQCLIDI